MEVKIVHYSTGAVLYWEQADSLIEGLEDAVRKGMSLDGADLRGLVLPGAKLNGGSFVGAHAEGANLIGASFDNADCTNMDISGAAITESTWSGATTTGMDQDALATAAAATTAGTCIPTTEKAAASGVASLNASSLVVQNPANASATPGASKIVIADGAGKLPAGWGGSASGLATLSAGSLVVENPANATATPTASKIAMTGAGGPSLAEGWRRPSVTAYDFATAVPYVVLATDEALDVTSGAVSDDVDLPTAVGCAGRTISIKKVDAGAGVIAVDPAGAEHIEGLGAGNPYNLTAQYQGVTLRSDGAKWDVVTSTTTTAAHAATHNPSGADEYKPAAVDTAAATPFTVLTTHRTLRCAAGAGAPQVVNLYAADAAAVGRRLAFIKTDVNAQNVAVTPAGADTINGVNNATLSSPTAQWDFVEIECVAVGAWMIVSRRIT